MPLFLSALRHVSRLLVFAATVAIARSAEPAHWPNWRGPSATGVAPAGKYPIKLDESQLRWQVPLPGKGCSTPIVWNQRIYLTAPVGGQDALLALDWEGKQLWQTTLDGETPGRHRNASGSNPSPVTDGTSVFVHFKSGHLAAIALDGKVRWQTNLVERFGPVNLFWDYGTSPVLTEKHVVIARMHGGESWLAAFDKTSGELRWKTLRNYEVPREVDNGYTTPLLIQHEGREALLTWGAQHLTLHDATSGALIWSCGDFNPTAASLWPAVASPVVADGVAIVCFGRADKGTPRLHGVRLGGKGDVTATHRAWTREDTGAFVPTPAVYDGKVYVLSDRGQLDCLEPSTGRTIWSETLPRSSSNFYASPLIAEGIMYAVREDGSAFVLQVKGGLKILAEHKFADRVIASIVPSDGRLFVRGEKHLYCLAATK
jgi:outer membrane protein assembly factor BamB